MSDRYQVPLEVVSLIEKAASGTPLRQSERMILEGFLISGRGQAPDEALSYVEQILDRPLSASELQLQAAEASPGDQVPDPDAVAAAMSGGAPLVPRKDQAPWGTDMFAGGEAAAAPSLPPISTFGDVPRTSSSVAIGDYGAAGPSVDPIAQYRIDPRTGEPYREYDDTDDTAPVDPRGQTPPARGDQRERGKRGKRGTDWVAERAAGGNIPIGAMPADSAFAKVSPDYLPGLSQNPDLAARLIAKQRGGGRVMADALAPQVESIRGMQEAGVLSGRKRLGGPESGGVALAQVQDVMDRLDAGEYIEPRPVYRRGLRNAANTPVEEMFTGEGKPGDLQNQILVTNGALLSASPYMTPESAGHVEALLQSAADEYLLAVAEGAINPDQMSYPMWLKREKKARKWVGGGPTSEQLAAGF